MKYCKGVVITGENTMAVSDRCPVPEEPCPTGALIRPLIWSPCTSDAHLCATGCASLPYLVGKAMGHEMCGEITKVGAEVQDFHVGDRVIVCAAPLAEPGGPGRLGQAAPGQPLRRGG